MIEPNHESGKKAISAFHFQNIILKMHRIFWNEFIVKNVFVVLLFNNTIKENYHEHDARK